MAHCDVSGGFRGSEKKRETRRNVSGYINAEKEVGS